MFERLKMIEGNTEHIFKIVRIFRKAHMQLYRTVVNTIDSGKFNIVEIRYVCCLFLLSELRSFRPEMSKFAVDMPDDRQLSQQWNAAPDPWSRSASQMVLPALMDSTCMRGDGVSWQKPVCMQDKMNGFHCMWYMAILFKSKAMVVNHCESWIIISKPIHPTHPI